MGGGPSTPAGKLVARLNGVTHGMRSTVPVISGEDSVEWETHRGGIIDALVPANALEAELAERIALLLWRMRRVIRFETDVTVMRQNSVEDEILIRENPGNSLAHLTPNPTIGEAIASKKRARDGARESLRILTEFTRYDENQPVSQDDAIELIRMVADEAEIDPDHGHFPSLPEKIPWHRFTGWTAAHLMQCVDTIAKRGGISGGMLLERARDTAHANAETATTSLARLERQLAMLQTERILPDSATLEKIMRYEGSLHRQLQNTLHEFEALQGRRRGAASPLARIDVTGIDPQE